MSLVYVLSIKSPFNSCYTILGVYDDKFKAEQAWEKYTETIPGIGKIDAVEINRTAMPFTGTTTKVFSNHLQDYVQD